MNDAVFDVLRLPFRILTKKKVDNWAGYTAVPDDPAGYPAMSDYPSGKTRPGPTKIISDHFKTYKKNSLQKYMEKISSIFT